MATTEEGILGALDQALKVITWKGPPSDLSHLNDPDHQAAFKELGNQEAVTSRRIKSCALSLEVGRELRVCSIGCGDGSLDRSILEGLKDKTLAYVGLEMDETLCEVAAEKMEDITSDTVTATTMVVDYEEDDLLQQNLDPFDLIWMVNCAYYVDQIGPVFQRAMKLLKPNGVLLVISSSRQSIDHLITKFWSHQRPGSPLHTTESVVQVLTQLKLPYSISREPVSFNLTAPFAEGFKSPQSHMLLDHLVFCRLSDYPPEVLKLVLEYLQHISHTDEATGHTLVNSLSDMISIKLN